MLIDLLIYIIFYVYLYAFLIVINKFFRFIITLGYLDFYYFLLIILVMLFLFLYEYCFIYNYIYNSFDNLLTYFNINYFFDEISQSSFLLCLFVSVFFFFILVLSKPIIIVKSAVLNIILIIFLSLMFIYSNSIFIIFISFELLLLVSLNLLKLTSKSERILEAVGEMFLWTLFGSFFLLLSVFLIFNFYNPYLDFFYNYNVFNNILSIFILLGFGVKIPIWPCLSWLLKAHVEASVEFSILLSGFIVKLGILGLIRILDNYLNNHMLYLLISLCILAIFDATLRLFAQQDLKRIVALTTVIEMNWLMLCFLLGDSQNLFLANFLIIAHVFSTTSEFLLVECLSKRFNSRDVLFIGSLWYNSPNLWYISIFIIFITIGFPGTSIFLAKFLFLPTLLNYSLLIYIYILIVFFLVLPIFFIRIWLPLWFGLYYKYNINFYDLSKKEFFIFFISILFSILLGLFPNFFLYIFI